MLAEVWTQPSCVYCTLAKQLLKDKGYEVVEHRIGETTTKEEFLRAVPSGVRSVPQIFIAGSYVGGYNDLKARFQ